MQTKIKTVEDAQLRKGIPDFRPGDRVGVHLSVSEGKRERTQVFEGLVIRRKGGGIRKTFTVRKTSFGIGVERIFPLHSPVIKKIEILKRGRERRANLSYRRTQKKR
ncbi:50S ribosomal protein L19 [Candidatus Aerophobetes bacterium]|uniref:50S ribosomal protein L19 n=1 Tax=Aerophobetes bacterium TaxID=2030807 RepID=A0A523VZ36_UNCAE|nr:50S ribosomal protein L19 [Candidatus Aerophobetes bacterium]TET59988.1 MAG: 50S ribosomal protein L19 [Candidatus Aerophobetes bacterium]